MRTLVFTSGDINGIGPEICLKAINLCYKSPQRKIIFICPKNVFDKTSEIIKPLFDFEFIKNLSELKGKLNSVKILDTGNGKISVGSPSKEAGIISYSAIESAFSAIKFGLADAMITAPVSKTSFKLAGIKFPGHTEILAHLSKSKSYMMVFLSNNFICGLATIHEQIKNVSGLLTREGIRESLKILDYSLKNDLGIINPEIAVLGLNPHAGEDGNIGKEEIEVIKPAIRSMKNVRISGPFVPDAFFGNQKQKKYNAVLGMYHDQVLIPFKMMNFNTGVNFTAGIPIIRTSPDHGTGYDIAGKGIANPQSILESVRWAEKIIDNRRKSHRAG
jgi:4-hydroxythreonine-4-phosphate dehydrogenase